MSVTVAQLETTKIIPAVTAATTQEVAKITATDVATRIQETAGAEEAVAVDQIAGEAVWDVTTNP